MTETGSTTIEFLSFLRSLDIKLAVENGKLGCTAPKGVLNPELTAQLKERKSEIIEYLQKNERAFQLPPLVAAGPRHSFPPSSGQQRLWFLEQFDPQNVAYIISSTVRLKGTLDRSAVARTLQEIVQRHEVLRTRFVHNEGAVRCEVCAAELPLEFQSLEQIPGHAQEEELKKLVFSEVRRPFDLATAPLVRACLFALSAEEHILVLTVHHIALDGWSVSILGDEFTQLYQAYAAGQEPPLPEPAFRYSDFLDWQRKHLGVSVVQSQVRYWKQQLRAPLAVTELPYDYPRPPKLTYNGTRSLQEFSPELAQAVQQFGRTENVTPFIALLTAFKIFLYRYTRETDTVVGSATAGRSRPELEKLVGLFINNLVLRTSLDGNPTVRQAIRRVRETVLNAYANENVPLDQLVELLQPERELNRSPLFQVMFVYQSFPMREARIPGLEMTPVVWDTGSSRYELTIEAADLDGKIVLMWEYNSDLFSSSTIARFQEHYRLVLESMIADTEQTISQVSILTDAERTMLSEGGAASRVSYQENACVHDLFEQRAAATPDAVALRFGNEQFTYAELNAWADRLAQHLRNLGVGLEQLVGLCLERSPHMVAAMLAVLKAGGAYLPLDPQFPKDRLAFMIENSQAAVLVTQKSLLNSVPQKDIPVLCLDAQDVREDTTTSKVVTHTAGPHNRAYVIYTSGSTGQPKGVEICHRSVVNFLTSMQHEPGFTASDRLVAVTTLSFDIAALEIFLPLVTGGELILAPKEVTGDGVRLAALLDSVSATVMQATPVTWRLLVEAGWKGMPGFKILCGGEALSRELANQLVTRAAEVWNLYGPTETTIWSAIERVTAGSGPVLIGKPIQNTELYALDEACQLTPPGVPGELYIGGDGLARGYLFKPELTRERFVPHPFRSDQRLYRTGDLVRRMSDGRFEYLARIDHQIKLRGFRIELGEIETALETQPGIRHAVVIVREDTSGDQRLAAYVVADIASAADPHTLRQALQTKLPEYMIPASFTRLDTFPLTPNRKVDRKALPKPQASSSVSVHYVKPRTSGEQEVVAIWQELLKTQSVGINDNFFDLGGHSLLVVQLQSRLRMKFKREIPLLELFQRPTIASIASLLDSTDAVRKHLAASVVAPN